VTQKQLEALGKKWQKRLRLLDWDIEFKFDKIPIPAHTDYIQEFKAATITVCTPVFYPLQIRPQNIDWSLIHEMLHLPTVSWRTENDAEEIMQEQALNQIA